MLRLRGLSARIVVAVVLLVALLQVAVAVLVLRANEDNARDRASEELVFGEQALLHALDSERRHLKALASLLAADPVLREALGGDPLQARDRLASRIALTSVHAVQVVDAGGVRASAWAQSAPAAPPEGAALRLADRALLARARQGGLAAERVIVEGRVYEVVAVPLAGPGGAAFVVLALAYDDALARRMQQLTGFGISFLLTAAGGPGQPLGTSQSPVQWQAIAGRAVPPAAGGAELMRQRDDEHALRLLTVAAVGEQRVQAVIKRALSDVLPVFERLRMLLLAAAAASVALALAAGCLMAHALTRPLRRLTEAAQRIRDGDYRAPIKVAGADEIGQLADSLNHMRQSIAERDEKNQKLAYSDTLTGLPNRTRLIRSIRFSIEQARSEQGIQPHAWVPACGHGQAAVMLLDLDRFKQINDTLGHRVGDAVLTIVSKRISQAVRPEDTVARLGGDEFAIAMPRADVEVARQVARQITLTLKAPIERDELNRELEALHEEPIEYDSSIDIGASIGFAVYPDHGADDQTLLRRADIAMYAAKRNHVPVAAFSTTHEVARLEHLSLLSELRRAVEESQLRAFYQPQIDLKTQRVVGAEALVRWRHPQRGLLAPAEFLPYAEQTGYIRVITRWMLAVTLRQCGTWAAAGMPVRVAVNLSASDLMRNELVKAVADLIGTHKVPPHLVCLEVTESTFMQDPEHALAVLRDLHGLGVHLSIDDFGTGFSSLAYLKRLPVHELKIDSTFVQGMVTGPKDVAIVRSTIELAHNLGLTVVAEGVEDERCFARLRELGCDVAQGYLLGRPMRRAAFENWQQVRAQSGGATARAESPAASAPQLVRIAAAG